MMEMRQGVSKEVSLTHPYLRKPYPQGVTSMLIGMMVRMRGGRLETFCISDQRTDYVKRAWLVDDMGFNLANLEDPEYHDAVSSHHA